VESRLSTPSRSPAPPFVSIRESLFEVGFTSHVEGFTLQQRGVGLRLGMEASKYLRWFSDYEFQRIAFQDHDCHARGCSDFQFL